MFRKEPSVLPRADEEWLTRKKKEPDLRKGVASSLLGIVSPAKSPLLGCPVFFHTQD